MTAKYEGPVGWRQLGDPLRCAEMQPLARLMAQEELNTIRRYVGRKGVRFARRETELGTVVVRAELFGEEERVPVFGGGERAGGRAPSFRPKVLAWLVPKPIIKPSEKRQVPYMIPGLFFFIDAGTLERFILSVDKGAWIREEAPTDNELPAQNLQYLSNMNTRYWCGERSEDLLIYTYPGAFYGPEGIFLGNLPAGLLGTDGYSPIAVSGIGNYIILATYYGIYSIDRRYVEEIAGVLTFTEISLVSEQGVSQCFFSQSGRSAVASLVGYTTPFDLLEFSGGVEEDDPITLTTAPYGDNLGYYVGNEVLFTSKVRTGTSTDYTIEQIAGYNVYNSVASYSACINAQKTWTFDLNQATGPVGPRQDVYFVEKMTGTGKYTCTNIPKPNGQVSDHIWLFTLMGDEYIFKTFHYEGNNGSNPTWPGVWAVGNSDNATVVQVRTWDQPTNSYIYQYFGVYDGVATDITEIVGATTFANGMVPLRGRNDPPPAIVQEEE